jgi:putative FmdB family regulatory protein
MLNGIGFRGVVDGMRDGALSAGPASIVANSANELTPGDNMPVYEYLCDDCGPFTDVRPMAECDTPQDCPQCAGLSRAPS